MILIGIDPGVNTGFAKSYDGELVEVKTCSIIEAMKWVGFTAVQAREHDHQLTIYIEDARKRKWVTGGREKLQGVGSVKRDAVIWEEFCVYHGIAYELVAPKNNNTKLDKETFKRLTGWQGRTSQHARDAVMLVWGRKR
ncbi:hypothetical protein LU290_03345 [Moraxella nasibovis]|uniref:hypothetical protein n=1 Tax=Moraxella nasibovis TaxID=2904120 RepID=UPI00241050AE|nr:hypothetical protein [Moraxella nasibovis]WFF39271.1 hypothetical protein LU290_03345 [Moraxella nasibovis]